MLLSRRGFIFRGDKVVIGRWLGIVENIRDIRIQYFSMYGRKNAIIVLRCILWSESNLSQLKKKKKV